MIVFEWMQRVWSLARGSSQANSRKTNVADELQSAARGLGFVPQRVRGVDLDPALAEQARAGHMTETAFARQCGLNAVFSWYVWFLQAGGEDEEGNVAEEDFDRERRSQIQRRVAIPGFPQASYQRVETQEHGLRVSFYDKQRQQLGAISLSPHGDSCTIDVEGGPRYLVREVSKAEDLWAEARQH
jgi:hypothetical protein